MYYRCCLLIPLQLKCASLEARATYAVLHGMGYESLMGMKKKIYPEIGNDAIWTVRFDYSPKWTVQMNEIGRS